MLCLVRLCLLTLSVNWRSIVIVSPQTVRSWQWQQPSARETSEDPTSIPCPSSAALANGFHPWYVLLQVAFIINFSVLLCTYNIMYNGVCCSTTRVQVALSKYFLLNVLFLAPYYSCFNVYTCQLFFCCLQRAQVWAHRQGNASRGRCVVVCVFVCVD